MQSKIHRVIITILVVCFPSFAFSQYVLSHEMETGTVGFYSGIGIPAGDFSSASGANSGGAQPGILIGVDYLYSITDVLNLSWISNLSFFYNGAELAAGFDLLEKGGTATSWIHLAPLVGLRAGGPITTFIDLYATVQGGLLWGLSPKIESSDQALEEQLDVWQNTGNGWSVAVHGGMSAVLKEHLHFAVQILYGQPTYEVRTVGKEIVTTQEGDIHKKVENYKFTQPTTLITITVGWFL